MCISLSCRVLQKKMNRGRTGVGLKGAVAFIGEDLDEVAAGATEEGGVAAAVVEAAVGTETYELAVGAEEGEEGVEEINSNNNKVKVHRRPAEEAEGVGQKEVWPMPVVEEEEEVVMANRLLLLRRLVVSKSRTVVKTSHHRSRNEHPVVLVMDAVGEVEEEGVATGDAEVAVLAVRVRAELEVAVIRRRRKETEIMPLPLLRVAVHSLADNQLRL